MSSEDEMLSSMLNDIQSKSTEKRRKNQVKFEPPKLRREELT